MPVFVSKFPYPLYYLHQPSNSRREIIGLMRFFLRFTVSSSRSTWETRRPTRQFLEQIHKLLQDIFKVLEEVFCFLEGILGSLQEYWILSGDCFG